ncbi:MAG: DUF1080 domain-containing protein, partial [Planctomycetes bacterium]|nr:DUF1080 domain-containing protein [Planctomycetota bacterium]
MNCDVLSAGSVTTGLFRLLAGVLFALSLDVAACAQEQNTLSPQEKEAGWLLLFDGQTTAGWRGYKSAPMPASWRVENGSLLSRREKGKSSGDIVTVEQYADFELTLEWKMTRGNNSGVIYRATEETANVW